jgi:hypothetical protein
MHEALSKTKFKRIKSLDRWTQILLIALLLETLFRELSRVNEAVLHAKTLHLRDLENGWCEGTDEARRREGWFGSSYR